jgi:hypothetical protein
MIDSFLEALRSNEALQQQLRGVFTAAGLADVATAAGLTINGASLVKGFAQLQQPQQGHGRDVVGRQDLGAPIAPGPIGSLFR